MVTQKRFDEGLKKKYNLTSKEIRESGYRYAGGDRQTRHKNYLKLTKIDPPGHETNCVCGHPIIENCYIYSDRRTDIIVLGNCCINKFVPHGLLRTCDTCGEVHKNRKRNTCNDCQHFLNMKSIF